MSSEATQIANGTAQPQQSGTATGVAVTNSGTETKLLRENKTENDSYYYLYIPTDPKKEEELFEQVAQGSVKDMWRMANTYLDRNRNPQRVYTLYYRASLFSSPALDDNPAIWVNSQGQRVIPTSSYNALANQSRGLCYLNGIGIERHYEEAVYWLGKAIQRDLGENPKLFPAFFNLANCYAQGIGVPQNFHRAILLYQIISNTRQFPQAANKQFPLEKLYSMAPDAPKKLEEAEEYYRKAADAGSAIGLSMMGFWHQLGLHGSRDHSRKDKYFLDAIRAGDVRCLLDLQDRVFMVPSNDIKCASEYLQLCEKNASKTDRVLLGKIYFTVAKCYAHEYQACKGSECCELVSFWCRAAVNGAQDLAFLQECAQLQQQVTEADKIFRAIFAKSQTVSSSSTTLSSSATMSSTSSNSTASATTAGTTSGKPVVFSVDATEAAEAKRSAEDNTDDNAGEDRKDAKDAKATAGK